MKTTSAARSCTASRPPMLRSAHCLRGCLDKCQGLSVLKVQKLPLIVFAAYDRSGGVTVSSYLMLPLKCPCPLMHEKRLREASVLQLLLRHFPELTPALDGLPNPFVTWNSPNQPAPLAPAFLPSAYDVENAQLNAQGKRRPGLQNRDPQPLFSADLLVQRLIAQKDIKIDDLPANPVVDCSLKAMLTPLEACLHGAGEDCCAAIDAAFAPSTNASTRNCLCLPPVETTGLAVGLGFGINFDEVRI